MKTNNLVILYSGPYPGLSAGAKRIALYLQGLQEAGMNVKVVSTYHSSHGITGFYLNQILQPFIIFLAFVKKLSKAKCLFVYGYSWETLFLIRVLSFLKSQKMVYEINEKPQAYYTNKILENPLIKKINLMMLSRVVFPLMDGFVVISDNLKDYIKKYQRRNAMVIKVPILIDNNIPELQAKNISLPNHFLFHSGALSDRKDGIIGVFEAFAIANKKFMGQLHFYLTNKIAPKNVLDKIESIIAQNNLADNVHFLDHISENELLMYQNHCSMLILNKPDNEQSKYNFSTKLGEYLRLKKPVIYTPIGEMNKYLKDGENAFSVPVDRPDLLAEKILFILNNDSKVKQIGECGALLAKEEFDYHVQGERLKLFFDYLLK